MRRGQRIQVSSRGGQLVVSPFITSSPLLVQTPPHTVLATDLSLKSLSLYLPRRRCRWFLISRFLFLNLWSFHRIVILIVAVDIRGSFFFFLQRVSLMARSSFKMEHPLGTTPNSFVLWWNRFFRPDSFDFLLFLCVLLLSDDRKILSLELLIFRELGEKGGILVVKPGSSLSRMSIIGITPKEYFFLCRWLLWFRRSLVRSVY